MKQIIVAAFTNVNIEVAYYRSVIRFQYQNSNYFQLPFISLSLAASWKSSWWIRRPSFYIQYRVKKNQNQRNLISYVFSIFDSWHSILKYFVAKYWCCSKQNYLLSSFNCCPVLIILIISYHWDRLIFIKLLLVYFYFYFFFFICLL